ILRDGRVIRTGPAAAETENSLVVGMLGRPAGKVYPEKRLVTGLAPAVLTVHGLSAPGVHDVSFELRAGEIVGLAGLVGAGRSELARAVYGAAATSAGEVRIGTSPIRGSPAIALRTGVAFIPESRKDDGLLLGRPIRENVSLTSLDRLRRFGLVRTGAERARVGAALGRVSAAPTQGANAGSLSGGNQQKLLFARALMIRPGILIADEPTRGVDVGAKQDLYALLVSLAADGLAVLLISNEIEEILGLSHRVLVMRSGRLVAEFAGPEMTEEAILGAAFGAAAPTAA
nr:sugar ABC transporter ATP-binding protein [Chloroflexota bacterium]